jgi:hypothetical protein
VAHRFTRYRTEGRRRFRGKRASIPSAVASGPPFQRLGRGLDSHTGRHHLRSGTEWQDLAEQLKRNSTTIRVTFGNAKSLQRRPSTRFATKYERAQDRQRYRSVGKHRDLMDFSTTSTAGSRSPTPLCLACNPPLQRSSGQQIAGAVGGIETRTVNSAARDRHDWNGLAGEGSPVSCKIICSGRTGRRIEQERDSPERSANRSSSRDLLTRRRPRNITRRPGRSPPPFAALAPTSPAPADGLRSPPCLAVPRASRSIATSPRLRGNGQPRRTPTF